jgi:20S proteasome alpha/beta subunit
MTIIAWDGKTLAADKMAINAGLIRTVTKIQRIDNLLVGFSGSLTNGLEMVEWVKSGRIASEFPDSQKDKEEWSTFVVVDNLGLIAYESSPIGIRFEDKFYATGSGRDYAIATMYWGHNAITAVRLASLYDNCCGNGIDSLTL